MKHGSIKVDQKHQCDRFAAWEKRSSLEDEGKQREFPKLWPFSHFGGSASRKGK